MAGGISSGILQQVVTLLRPVEVADGFGQMVRTWEVVGDCWANFIGSGGGTSVSLNHTSITYSHTVRIRQCPAIAGINPTWRAKFNGNIMEISSVIDPDYNGAVWELQCSEEKPRSEPGATK